MVLKSKHIAYVFTINNYIFDDIQRMINVGNQKYLIFGFEIAPDTGTPHIQGCVVFYNHVHWTSFKKQMPRAWFEPMRGTVDHNFVYTGKENEQYEFGEKPKQGFASWELIEQAMKDPKSNPRLYVQYKKHYESICESYNEKKKTRFFVIDPVFDPITECYDYFGWDESDKLAVVTDLSQLQAYDEYDHIIYYVDFFDRLHSLWSRGVPITYKYGYEIKKVNCYTLVIVTSTPGLYPHYKKIK